MATLTHPKCGKTFPNNNRDGHCAACCETFIGLTSFEAHRVGEHGKDRRCEIQPYETIRENGSPSYGHWTDERGYQHYGKQLTPEESAALIKLRKGEKS